LVCGNKIDLEEKRVLDFQTASGAAAASGALYAETSAQTNTGVDRMFQLAISTHLKKKGKPAPDSASPNLDLAAKPAAGSDGKKCC
jgi:GTPase SAR1 family protein